jgi:4-hydroxybenzoate polyprenyltransferase
VLLLLAAGVLASAGPLYYLGVILAAVLVVYERRLIAIASNLFVLNERIFVTNMAFSVVFLGTTVVSFLAR